MKHDMITLGGGCFWCVEAVFQLIDGVISVESGYSGGHTKKPTYKSISTGETGHAEVVQIMFNSDVVTLGELLEIFFTSHNPTTLNKQGNDVGTQYRSIILYHDPVQKRVVERVMKRMNEEVYDGKIVTEVQPFEVFHKAELYHQNYYRQNGGERYCQIVIDPKVLAVREKYADKIKKGAM